MPALSSPTTQLRPRRRPARPARITGSLAGAGPHRSPAEWPPAVSVYRIMKMNERGGAGGPLSRIRRRIPMHWLLFSDLYFHFDSRARCVRRLFSYCFPGPAAASFSAVGTIASSTSTGQWSAYPAVSLELMCNPAVEGYRSSARLWTLSPADCGFSRGENGRIARWFRWTRTVRLLLAAGPPDETAAGRLKALPARRVGTDRC